MTIKPLGTDFSESLKIQRKQAFAQFNNTLVYKDAFVFDIPPTHECIKINGDIRDGVARLIRVYHETEDYKTLRKLMSKGVMVCKKI